jgi:GntR family transcriptional regulator
MAAFPRRLLKKVDRAGPPAYAQIEDRLAEAILGGDLKPGDRLPSERELAARVSVSRMTLRQALDSLERRGLLARSVGRRGGTFVAQPKIERDLTALSGLTQQLRRQGRRAGARVVSATEIAAGLQAAEALGIERDAPVSEIVRLRYSDGEPLALERSLFPADRFPGLLGCPLAGSLYQVLEDHFGVHPTHAVESLEPVVADAREADALGVKAGAPLMLVERTAFGEDGLPLEWARDLFRGDRTRVVVETSLFVPASVHHPRAARTIETGAS